MMQTNEVIPDDAPALVSAVTVGRWFGVSDQTVYNWAASGRLPAPIRLGKRKWVFSTTAVRATLAQRILESQERRA